MLVAEDVREIMASLGVRRFQEMIGHTELLDMDAAIEHWKAKQRRPVDGPRRHPTSRRTRPAAAPAPQVPVLDDALDWELVRKCAPGHRATASRCASGRCPCATSTAPSAGSCPERSRAATACMGCPEGTIEITFSGSAGQSFGAWLAPGVTFSLRGETNDYTGKGLSGGIVSVRPPETALFRAEENMIVGNTVLYGATAGRAFFRGLAGERFAVRNSGALRRRRGRRRSRLRVHDRRPGGRARAHGTELRRRHERRHRLRVRRRPALRQPLQHRARRPRALGDADADEVETADRRARPADRLAGRPQRARLLGARARERFVKVMPRDYKRALQQQMEEPEVVGA